MQRQGIMNSKQLAAWRTMHLCQRAQRSSCFCSTVQAREPTYLDVSLHCKSAGQECMFTCILILFYCSHGPKHMACRRHPASCAAAHASCTCTHPPRCGPHRRVRGGWLAALTVVCPGSGLSQCWGLDRSSDKAMPSKTLMRGGPAPRCCHPLEALFLCELGCGH